MLNNQNLFLAMLHPGIAVTPQKFTRELFHDAIIALMSSRLLSHPIL